MSRKHNPQQPQPDTRIYREMTVVLIRDHKDADAVEVAFSESARFYRLSRQNPSFAAILSTLRQAKDKKHVVRVEVDFPDGDVIHDAQTERSTED